jgi:integrase/recombinase XerD
VYRHFGRQLQAFADQRSLKYLADLDLDKLTDFRASWPNRNVGALKKFELLRTVFAFCFKRHWIGDNPATDLEKPKAVGRPTLPFSRDEMIRILSAAESCKDSALLNERRLRALVLLLRYSGLRIGDAVTLTKDRIGGDKLFLYTSKAHVAVYLPLPPFVIEALESVSLENLAHYFWTGQSKPKTAISHWQSCLKRLFRLAQIEGGHAHRFRDTFATELLLSGVLIERVATLLGHESTKTTEKHYRHWVKARQEQLEADVRKSWGDWLTPTLGTPMAHGARSIVN